ncbi:MAG: metallopeptidase family protein [Planctomycetaceae bacterium]|jgi:predicted Zn-dependent protease with MMP-like domain|nr:metallopeptidase family protein [Planctomycetaceae bacterium]
MDDRVRKFFDRQVRWVLKRLPRQVRCLLGEVPLRVEDHPSVRLRKELNIHDRGGLLGHFSGVSRNAGIALCETAAPAFITIYRLGIFEAVTDETGRINLNELREQIRITVLHELGHYHGLEEEELDEIGYG